MNLQNFPKQTLLRENGETGNCWQYCIAFLLGVNPEEVPHFLRNSMLNNTCMDVDTQTWLNKRDYAIVRATKLHFYRKSGMAIPLLIACGPTCRSTKIGQHHAVIMMGDKMVYDPHPSEAGLTAIMEEYLIFSSPTASGANRATV